MGQDRPPLCAVGHPAGVQRGQPAEPVFVHDGARGGGQGCQVRAVAGGDRPDVAQSGAGEIGEVVLAVLPCVKHHRHLGGRRAARGSDDDRLVLAAELADHRGELGDVGPVAGVGVPGQRDPPVAGDHQAQAHQPQVRALLPGLAPLRDRRLLVRRVDERGEVGHVQRHRGHIHPGCFHDAQRDLAAGLLQLLQRDGMHRVPEPPVIQRRSRNPGEPGRRRLGPPVGEGELGTRCHHPVQRGQHQICAHGHARIGAPRPGCLVDDGSHAEDPPAFPRQPRPRRSPYAEPGRAARARRRASPLPAPPQYPGTPGRDPRLAMHASRLHQVVVGGPAALLPHDRCHIWVIHHRARRHNSFAQASPVITTRLGGHDTSIPETRARTTGRPSG